MQVLPDAIPLPSFPGLVESLRALPAALTERARGPLLILGASGFLGSWMCRAAVLANESGITPPRPIFAASNHHSSIMDAAVGAGVHRLSHQQAIERIWPGDTTVVCLFGSSRPWADQSSGSKLSEAHLMSLWMHKAQHEGFQWTLASTGACAPVDSQGMSRETGNCVPRMVAASDPSWATMSYVDARLAWESMALDTPRPVIARVHSALGPSIPPRKQWACWSMAESLAAGAPAIASAPEALRPWMHPADITAWLFWLAHNCSGIYNLAPAASHTMSDLARDLALAWNGMPVAPGSGHPGVVDARKCHEAGLRAQWQWPAMVAGFATYAKLSLESSLRAAK